MKLRNQSYLQRSVLDLLLNYIYTENGKISLPLLESSYRPHYVTYCRVMNEQQNVFLISSKCHQNSIKIQYNHLFAKMCQHTDMNMPKH